ncbi:MAG: CHC2 zinc finger domain-containing protein [Alistipes finegoldii]
MNDLKNISIRLFLARRGIQPKYERNGYGMYLSPLRDEHTPSFKVDYVQNLWYDFGLGEGGTLLTLVMRLERCDSREAIRRLQNGEKGTPEFLFHRIFMSVLSLAGHRRPCARPPSPRSGFSPTLRSVIRHWSVISLRAASSPLSPRHSAAKFVTR